MLLRDSNLFLVSQKKSICTRRKDTQKRMDRATPHYSPEFVECGGHRAVAEALNEGQCAAWRQVIAHFAPGAPHAAAAIFLPLYVYCRNERTACTEAGSARRSEASPPRHTWSLTPLTSGRDFEAAARRLVTKRTLRGALLQHAPTDVDRVHDALSVLARRRQLHGDRKPPVTLLLRLVMVFPDESSHVNVVLVRNDTADLFEPKTQSHDTHDTARHPFGTLRTHVGALLARHGVRLHDAGSQEGVADTATFGPLQTDDDLCQTWTAAYVKEWACHPTETHDELLHRLRSPPPCDRLCRVLRFSQEVYHSVPFERVSRRGGRLETLAERRASTSRSFHARPGPCGLKD